MISQIFDKFIPLFFLGAMAIFGLFFHLLIRSVNSYYRKFGKLTKGKIIAFKEETNRRRTNGRYETSTTIRPVIEYIKQGERKLFLGTNQNYLNNFIGKEVEIYLIEDKEDQVLQKDNVYKIFTYVSLLFVIIPLVIIGLLKVETIYKITIPTLSLLTFLPIALVIKTRMRKYLIASNDQRGIFETIREKMITNNDIIALDDFDKSDKYIKTSRDFKKKTKIANLFGVVFSLLFGGGIYFLIQNLYTKRISQDEKQVINNFLEDVGKYQPLLDECRKSNDIFILIALCGFAVILTYAFIKNLSSLLKS
ncbi:hypothetical protein M902_0783 [Bacteriovorax sp. BAL6_X]|uniref:hypothetical protein n=1 Tax=Bacteriovorax sp. BAL6_X TaxID=1201290 RepID=UPI0003868EDA|nr:hypothetical protein [Bacteriovorax sp. BAL6_X]EPZ49432.1 hypothetical protein M902_0783 [Bacteriovorax sp. BAL6_X]